MDGKGREVDQFQVGAFGSVHCGRRIGHDFGESDLAGKEEGRSLGPHVNVVGPKRKSRGVFRRHRTWKLDLPHVGARPPLWNVRGDPCLGPRSRARVELPLNFGTSWAHGEWGEHQVGRMNDQ